MKNSIFVNKNFFNLSDPLPAWLFDVVFYNDDASGSLIHKECLIADSITLPQHTTEIVTKKYFGSEKSFPILRTYGSDIDLEFTLRSNQAENIELYEIAQVMARHEPDKKEEGWQYPYHPEVEYVIPKKNPEIYEDIKNVKKIEVRVRAKDNTAETVVDKSGMIRTNPYVMVYEFKNCVLKQFSFNTVYNYQSDDIIKCKLTYHTDIWSVKDIKGDIFC